MVVAEEAKVVLIVVAVMKEDWEDDDEAEADGDCDICAGAVVAMDVIAALAIVSTCTDELDESILRFFDPS